MPDEAPATSAAPEPENPTKSAAKSPHLWVSTTYFAEGFPYAIVNNVAEVIFQQVGAGLGVIGLTSLFHLPWNLKFLWAPLLDKTETKRSWLVLAQLVCAALLILLGIAAASAHLLVALSLGFFLLAFVSATNDVAVDGYYMEALDETGQSRFVGYRALAYRAATLLVKGPFFLLAAAVGFSLGLTLAGVVLAALGLVHAAFLPRIEVRRAPLVAFSKSRLRTLHLAIGLALVGVGVVAARLGAIERVTQAGRELGRVAPFLARISFAGYVGLALFVALAFGLVFVRRRPPRTDGALGAFLTTPHAGRLLAFVVLFRAGESLLQKMKWPFLNGELGIGLSAYGVANGTVGVLASFVGTLLGGRLIARDGLGRWFWPFLLAQNVLNLLYVGLAAWPDGRSLGIVPVTVVIALEEFGAGLGTAVLMVFLMRACHPRYKAAHFALLTALMSVSFTFSGAVSGFLAEALGYTGFFFVTFVATWPMMLLALGLPRDGRSAA